MIDLTHIDLVESKAVIGWLSSYRGQDHYAFLVHLQLAQTKPGGCSHFNHQIVKLASVLTVLFHQIFLQVKSLVKVRIGMLSISIKISQLNCPYNAFMA